MTPRRQTRPVPALAALPGGQDRTGVRLHHRTIHGYRRAFLMGGRGPALLLIHGIGESSATWADLLPALARDHTVIAPDLLGHGDSDKPRADYAVPAYACGMRDLLSVLDIDSATVVGHSLGGGVAMQFAYQFPERCERLVLVGTGGIGREVCVPLRAAASPGADLLLPLITPLAEIPPVPQALRLAGALLRRLGRPLGGDLEDLVDGYRRLSDPIARSAFLRTLRAVVDVRGQVVTMLDRSYLAAAMPTLLVWGDKDPVIPFGHAAVAHSALPGSRLEVFEGAGHFPHHADPDRFLAVLRDFLATTAPAEYDPAAWRELLRSGGEDEDRLGFTVAEQDVVRDVLPSGT